MSDRAEQSQSLLEAMRRGEVEEGRMTLRARIDMSSPNLNLRDPVIYRIKRVAHHRTGTDWSIYPSYDFAHGQEDAIEGVTHSICTLEFEDHRPLYDWFVENLPVPHRPRQYEFARLNVNYLVTSKRKLKQLVDQGYVADWDDPRMPTLSGTASSAASARRPYWISVSVLALPNRTAWLISACSNFVSAMTWTNTRHARCVCCRPLKLTLSNYPEQSQETLAAANHPNRPEPWRARAAVLGQIYIDRDDFRVEGE